MSEKLYLTRVEASEYMTRKGVPVAKNTLQKFATVGGGPAYRVFGNRAFYTVEDLDSWLSEKMGAPRRSTSEVPCTG